ncbi:MAG: two-component regulator propeller domain-containing protein, partial [Dokdonella sp.]|uniref:ligand-binding sensor domain-containing protein n=1 Tax=Dokdonella sp. TaxID=2291710 RepID=UPI0032641032
MATWNLQNVSRGFRAWVVLAVVIFFAGPLHRASALDPHVHVSQYGHTAWRTRDGYFHGAPQVFAQTTDGYLWIGTANGLVRFDGIRFEPFLPTAQARPPSGSIVALMAARDGALWIGSYEGLARLHDGRLFAFPDVKGAVWSIIDDPLDAEVWFARTRVAPGEGPLCRIRENAARCFGTSDGIPIPAASLVVREAGGAIWLSGTDALVRWEHGESTSYFRQELAGHQNLGGLAGLVVGPDGAIWTVLPDTKGGLSLERFQSGQWSVQSLKDLDSEVVPTTLFFDTHGALWLGTDSHGLYRIVDSKLEHFTSVQGLSGDRISEFFEDGEGNIWVATSAGIDCFRNLAVLSVSKREGLSADDATVVASQDDGTVWVGNGAHLDRIDTAHGMHVGTEAQVKVRQVTAIADGGEGRLWVGADQDVLIHENGRTYPLRRSTGLPIGAIELMAVEPGRDAWLVPIGKSPRRIIHMHGDAVVSDTDADWALAAPDPTEGLWLAQRDGKIARVQRGQIVPVSPGPGTGVAPIHARQILPTTSGRLWMATREGLVEFDSGTFRRMDERNGLPCTSLFALQDDLVQALWLYAACGVMRIDHENLQRWEHDATATLSVQLFDVLDGAEPALADFSPHATRSPDGRIWFANGSIVQMVDPSHGGAPAAPPIHIERAIGDRSAHPLSAPIVFPALTGNIEFDYSAPSFAAPQKVSFRYRLEGHDESWQEPGSRRQAFYNDISPGSYTFNVIARNADG